MRVSALLFAGILTLTACSSNNVISASTPRTQASSQVYSLPNHVLTPGEVLTVDRAAVCQPGYTATIRHTTPEMKRQVEREYGYTSNPGEIDHLIALELGGADTVANLWAQPSGQYQVKDMLENLLHSHVCSRNMQIQDAQQCIRSDWVACARRFGVIQ